ncbi:MAG: OB-fold nucleic acid binding domain-containing protein [Eubacteriales bacterium]|nr:OB-fold nucleic acid binding domain-containing protein [Eubacteriales bacterium]MDD3881351.1 OB-fold nucleic acid binding domain-containing protein [Eubacteriales bacterium]MDD4513678.1 OB-fold nucleic acid binding domain-containing protein [Eubacteriales bacterium]
MQQPDIVTLQKDMSFEGFVLVRSSEQRVGSNGSRYLDMTLCDKTGEINAKLWDGAYAPPKTGSVVKVRATVQEFKGHMQLRIDRMRALAESDDIDIASLTPCAPEKPEDMLAEITQTVDSLENADMKSIVRVMLAHCGDKLIYWPAASKMHHAIRSGLLYHTVTMLRAAKAIAGVYKELDRDLLYSGVIIHDLAKISEMDSDEMGGVSEYTVEGQLLGHLVKGVSDVRAAAEEANVTGEIPLLLEHMVISHHGTAEFGSPRLPMFMEADVLHWLDILDAHMYQFSAAVSATRPGGFSDKVWSLDRRVYRPAYGEEQAEMQPDDDGLL